MTSQYKQIAIYGFGIPFGERPRSSYRPVILPDAAEVEVAPGKSAVAFGTSHIQTGPPLIWIEPMHSSIDGQIRQDQPAEILIEPVSASETLEILIRPGKSAVYMGNGASQIAPAEVYLEPLLSTLTLLPITIVVTDPPVIYVSPQAGTTGRSQGNPAEIVLEPMPASTGEHSQLQPAEILFDPRQSVVSNVIAQDKPVEVWIEPNPGIVWKRQVFVQDSPPVIYIEPRPAGYDQPPIILVDAGSGTVTVGVGQSGPGEILIDPGQGSVSSGKQISQGPPPVILTDPSGGTAVFTPSEPITVVVTGPAEVLIAGPDITIGFGEDPLCRWFAPADCLNEATIAHKIMYKQPAESIWLAYNFRNRLDLGEEIDKILTVDDSGSGIVASAAILSWYDDFRLTEVKYRVAGGTAGQNVRMQHRVQTTNGRILEGDGFVYIREGL